MLALLMTLLILVAIFLIVLILVQKGRGGGLAGALGGMGGRSAFGAKAGDVFTRITIVVATIWILLSIVTFSYCSRMGEDKLGGGNQPPAGTTPPGTTTPGTAPTDPNQGGTPAVEPLGPAITPEPGTTPAPTTPSSETPSSDGPASTTPSGS